MASFAGFSKPFVVFFTGLKKNNSKSYFDAKRKIYENVVKPKMAAFILELLKLKQYLLEEEEPVKKWIDDPRIVKRTLESFRASAPLVQFLCTALNVPF